MQLNSARIEQKRLSNSQRAKTQKTETDKSSLSTSVNGETNTNGEIKTKVKKQNYFPPTTAEQRRLLFETWEKTGNIQESCRIAGVSRTTFYHWRERFLAEGFEALERPRSNAPHRPRRVASHIEQRVIEMRQRHPTWGKLRISKEVNRQIGPKAISPNSVMRILVRENIW